MLCCVCGVGAAAGGDYWGRRGPSGWTGRTPHSPGARDGRFPEGPAALPAGRLLPGSARPPLLSRAAPAHLAQTCPPTAPPRARPRGHGPRRPTAAPLPHGNPTREGVARAPI